MRLSKLAVAATAAFAFNAGQLFADQANEIRLVSDKAPTVCDCGDPACGAESIGDCAVGCDGHCGTAGGCRSGLGLGLSDHLSDTINNCCLGEPWSLFGEHGKYSAGGWVQMGYHNNALPLFNERPDEFQMQQAWLYAERQIDTSQGFDIGGRIDYVYGTDGPNTQAFGTDPRGWDNSWDNGPDNSGYGHALPQVYLEAGYGDLSVIMGHFYTIIGWEVVPAPNNFFYSHAYTMVNSEPFTHTGVLGTYDYNDDVTLYGGHTFGWDSGFDDNGDAFLGGLSLQMTDLWNLTYATTAGRFGERRFNDVAERGYMHSIVSQYSLTDRLQYISQSDVLSTEDAAGNTVRDTYGLNQYLIYRLNDCWAVGSRFEWWQVEKDSRGFYGEDQTVAVGDEPPGDFDVYALTFGLNYRPHANVIVRPEIRWDWVQGLSGDEYAAADIDLLEDNDRSQATFGIDTIFQF